MKFKIITGIALSLISINALAEKTISEHFKSTPGFNAGIYSLGSKKNSLSPQTASARVSVNGKSGRVRDFIKIDANHSIDINNKHSKTMRYTYRYNMKCADMSANYDRTIELEPGESFHNSSYSYGTVQRMEPGTWRIEAETIIEGSESDSARDSATLEVHK